MSNNNELGVGFFMGEGWHNIQHTHARHRHVRRRHMNKRHGLSIDQGSLYNKQSTCQYSDKTITNRKKFKLDLEKTA